MANQSASNNQPRPARDTRPSGDKMLTGSRCSLSHMRPKRFTAHQALAQILADDSEDIDASDYGNDSDFESEISADSSRFTRKLIMTIIYQYQGKQLRK